MINSYYSPAAETSSNIALLPNYDPKAATLSQIRQFVFFRDTSLNPVSVTLPPSSESNNGNTVVVIDYIGNAGVQNITVLPAGEDTINGGSSLVIAVGYGSMRFELYPNGQWYTLDFLGGAGGGNLVGATNGLNVVGTNVLLGGALIHNTTVTAGAFNLVFSSTTTHNVLGFSLLPDESIGFTNTDIDAGATRAIGIIPQSASNPQFSTGGVTMGTQTAAYGQSLNIMNQNIELYVTNKALSSGHGNVAALQLTNTLLYAQVFTNNTTSSAPLNGLNVSQTYSSLNYNCNPLTGGAPDLTTGNVLQLDTNGVTLFVANSPVFIISPTGAITASGLTASVPVTAGQLYRSSASPHANVLIV